MPRLRRIGRVAPAPERSEGRASYGDAGACCSRSCDGDGRVAGDAERCAGDVFGAIAGPVVDARWAAVHAGRRGERRVIRTDSKRRISYYKYSAANFQPRNICNPPMQLAGATPDPRGGSPLRSRAEGRVREATRARCRARRGRPRAPGPQLLPSVLQYVTTCPNIRQHRRPRPRGGRPRPPRGRSWACTRPPPRRREGRRGRGRGST